MSENKVSGPASYFLSIEKKYGQSIDYLMHQLDAVADQKHMEQVALLKEKSGIGHSHANAPVAVFRARDGESRKA